MSYRVPGSQTSEQAPSWRVWSQSQPPAWKVPSGSYSRSEHSALAHLPEKDAVKGLESFWGAIKYTETEMTVFFSRLPET